MSSKSKVKDAPLAEIGTVSSLPSRRGHGNIALWRHMTARVLDFILPWRCAGCRKILKDGDGLCPDCWKDLYFLERPYCECLGIPFAYDLGDKMLCAQAISDPPSFDRARAAVAFGPVAQQIVHNLKYRDRLDLASLMAAFMMRAGGDLLKTDPLLVAVPLHRNRLLRRRFNQSDILVRRLAEKTRLNHEPHLLLRTRKTRQQVGLDIGARKKNVRRAFSVSDHFKERLRGRSVVLVDDVLTTGATVEACSKVLKRAGASSVDVLTFARVLPSEEVLPG